MMKDWIPPTLLTIFCYGLWGFFPKLAVEDLNPQSVVIYQALGSVLMTLIIPFLPGFEWHYHPKAVFWSLLTGIVTVIGNIFFTIALKKGQASIITPLTATYPVISLLLATIFLQETITLRQGLGIALALIAALLLGL